MQFTLKWYCNYFSLFFHMVLALATVPGDVAIAGATTWSHPTRAVLAHRLYLVVLLHEPVFEVVMTQPEIFLRLGGFQWWCGGGPAPPSPVFWTWLCAAPRSCGASLRG